MHEITPEKQQKCGYIAIVGRPNVGKSTLLNFILGEKISITSSKPQTTRHKLLGIKTVENVQAIYVDTPGIYKPGTKNNSMNRQILKTALNTIFDVDVIIFVVEANKWQEQDELILEKLTTSARPIIIAINKIDKLTNQSALLPYIGEIQTKANLSAIVPISAKNNKNLTNLTTAVTNLLPLQHFLFPDDQLTDKNDKFLAAEIVREKLMRYLGAELPYCLDVSIESFTRKKTASVPLQVAHSTEINSSLSGRRRGGTEQAAGVDKNRQVDYEKPNQKKRNVAGEEYILHIHALIIVAKASHKPMIIGANGEKLKSIGTKARLDMEKLFGCKVFLKLWLKVKPDWTNNERMLTELGY